MAEATLLVFEHVCELVNERPMESALVDCEVFLPFTICRSLHRDPEWRRVRLPEQVPVSR